MIYQIFMGTDNINAPIQLQPESLIAQYNNFKDAYNHYKRCQERCVEMCNEEQYEMNRNYCYMIEVNPEKRLIGYIKDKKIDNGSRSLTIMAHNYAKHPRLHYMEKHEEGFIKIKGV